MNDFLSLELSSDLTDVLTELGFEKPTPIQRDSIPHLLANRDLVGQAKTGSGKTAAFALPILQRVNVNKRDVQAMILCPTRELCQQVAREIRKLARKMSGLQVLVLCGGEMLRPQSEALEKGVHIIVGTPGRIVDHIERRNIGFQSLKTLVLDEADRMLDMGFANEMAIILDETPRTRQTIFFSATFPDTIRSMSREHQIDPITVKVSDPTENASSIRQVATIVEEAAKVERTLQLLRQIKPESALIFCRMKMFTTEIAKKLNDMGQSASALNGDMEQRDRDRVMAMFKNQSLRILVATDVAARGLDVANLGLVINFDLPPDGETYLHRIGRTGRAGQAGLAISLIDYRAQMRLEEYVAPTGGKLEMNPSFGATPSPHAPGLESKMQTLYIAGGRKEKMRPGDILGALTGEGIKLQEAEIGKIEIHDHFAYVAVASSKAEFTVSALRMGRIKGRRFLVSLVALE